MAFFVFVSQTREMGEGWSMAVRLPTLDQINDLGADFGLVLTADEIAAFQQAFKGPLTSYGRLDELVPPTLALVRSIRS
jgi:amidase